MIIECKDGGTLECFDIVVYDDAVYCDDCWTLPLDAIERIVDGEREDY